MKQRLIASFILLNIIPLVFCYEGITQAECPFLCECAGFEVTCDGTDVFPDGISEKVRKFQLTNSLMNFIPINAFKNLRALEEIKISGTNITTVRACSFAELENMTSIIFENVFIDVMEGNVFSNLKNVTKIEFKSSKIREFKSYSFHNITDVGKVLISKTDISVIHPFAFLKLKKVAEIQIESCNIDKFLGDGISRIEEITSFAIQNSHVKEWQCGTLSTLADKGAELDISGMKLQCDCKISWLFKRFSNSTIFAAESGNKCYGTDKPLATISLDEICTSPGDKTCHRLLPSTPHTCRKSFDQPFNPEEKVEYPSYFTKKPRAVASSSLNNVKLHLVLFVLLVSLDCAL